MPPAIVEPGYVGVTVKYDNQNVTSNCQFYESDKTTVLTTTSGTGDYDALLDIQNYSGDVYIKYNNLFYPVTLTSGSISSIELTGITPEVVYMDSLNINNEGKIEIHDARISDISDFVQKSNTSGLLKNDGTVDTNEYVTVEDLEDTEEVVAAALVDLNTNKQNTLTSQTAYTSVGSSTAIPSITTNSLGQVTEISTVAISIPDTSGKADKVANATSGNFAALDANGNLTDSGHSHSDYLTQHQSLSNYVTLDGAQNITGEKTFVGTKRIKFKQSTSSDKLGFTLYNTSSVESGNFEGDIANRAINLGIYAPNTKPASDWLVGFKIQAQDSAGTVHKYGLRTPPRLGNSTYAEFYIPVVINGVSANNAGVLTLTANDVGALPSTTVVPSDSDLVHKTGDETIAGDKTFTGVINATDINGDLYGAIYASHAEIYGGVIAPPVDGNLGTLTLESIYDTDAKLIVGNSQGYPEGETPEDQATGGWIQIYNEATDTTLQDELDNRDNVIEAITFNGSPVPITNKTAAITGSSVTFRQW